MATIYFSPTSASAQVGQQVSFQVIADGEGAPLVVSQFQLSYPQSELTPVSFTFAPGWTQTFDVGTNVMASGTVIQAGGYTATFNGAQVMGTMTFTAQKTGEATIALSKTGTYMFEGDSGGNQYDGSPSSVSIGISPGANGETSIAPPTQPQTVTSGAPTSSQSDVSFGWVGYVIIAIVILLVVWLLYKIFKKKKRSKRRGY